MSVEDVVAAVDRYGCPLVEITGGEPLLQDDVYDLMERLLETGRTVMLETGGHRPIACVPSAVRKIVDVKCPGSQECGAFCRDNLASLLPHDQVKFVLADRLDYEWACRFLEEHRLPERVEAVIFSPVFGALEPRPLAEWILQDGLPVRLGLQLHKFIWHPDMRGV